MTVETLALDLGLWVDICRRIITHSEQQGVVLVETLSRLPVKRSRATRTLGSYLSRGGEPVCIRLQFAQEPDHLKQTLLHEIAHVCDHLSRQDGQGYRQAHGRGWRLWAEALGIIPERLGSSEVLRRLHQQRLKPVAVCQRCGTVLQRVRRLNRRLRYIHTHCGGRWRPI